MEFEEIAGRGLVLVGCGKMGSALLEGWLRGGLPPDAVWVVEPNPSDWLRARAEEGVHLSAALPPDPRVVVLAVKPQMMAEALPQIAQAVGAETLVLSIAAGTPIAAFEAAFGPGTAIVRAMPNTPAAIGQGISAIVGNAAAGAEDLTLAERLMRAVGDVVRLDDEAQMDAVTAVSGSGPAYVFLLIEALAAAGAAEGLSPELALRLARATVAGAGALAIEADEGPDQLRRNVTSPGGTTEAALRVLMDEAEGLGPLVRRAVHAAAERSRELGKAS
ncbi:MAG: pyrroline-5-carboxylate reductase [Alphaproteobacteria bacterium]|nr:MAG: pyrroline-5-carboxylate reductase [Alphaproteobacteria bacterium]